MARWRNGEQTVQFLINRGRLESFEAADLTTSAEALIARARLRVEATAKATLKMGDIDGAYVAAYDAYRTAAESLLARQGATGAVRLATGEREPEQRSAGHSVVKRSRS